ncbi:hypothetical protein N7472_004758 [Penicillium cf. griseofulvum]|uniref:Uncharacterized protein n=1 Tax=Penicillium cf. griseofulvum TaxID=2972120 RepID=A0A9W9MF45_9EURO|nr:hypothetical protein N7472_004758 [Penicillium cf. griseofulvum]KAJ5442327.1 hypothetical protein N7445_005334 [Penicillium cf. griseofulvum]
MAEYVPLIVCKSSWEPRLLTKINTVNNAEISLKCRARTSPKHRPVARKKPSSVYTEKVND